MKKSILISEEEKRRILSMHVNAGLGSTVSENFKFTNSGNGPEVVLELGSDNVYKIESNDDICFVDKNLCSKSLEFKNFTMNHGHHNYLVGDGAFPPYYLIDIPMEGDNFKEILKKSTVQICERDDDYQYDVYEISLYSVIDKFSKELSEFLKQVIDKVIEDSSKPEEPGQDLGLGDLGNYK
jgi:hypothetical protein